MKKALALVLFCFLIPWLTFAQRNKTRENTILPSRQQQAERNANIPEISLALRPCLNFVFINEKNRFY